MTADLNMGKWKAIFGFCLLMCIASLAAIIALGHVEEHTSFGLQIILGCLTTLSGAFAGWAFGHDTRDDKEASKGDSERSQP